MRRIPRHWIETRFSPRFAYAEGMQRRLALSYLRDYPRRARQDIEWYLWNEERQRKLAEEKYNRQ